MKTNLFRTGMMAIVIILTTTLLKSDRCPAVNPLDHTVLLPNPDDCSSFFMCSDGVPILQKCPEGLHFNAHLKVCDWPQNAGCESPEGDDGGCTEVLKAVNYYELVSGDRCNGDCSKYASTRCSKYNENASGCSAVRCK